MRLPVLALAAALLVAPLPAPSNVEVSGWSAARADDDDGGGGRGGRGSRGGRGREASGGGGGSSALDFILQQRPKKVLQTRPKKPARAARPRRPGAQTTPPPPPPPAPAPAVVADEIIVAAVTGAELDLIAAAGFEVVVRSTSALLTGEIARLRLPAGTDAEAARAQIQAIAPAAILDENHLYRPVEMPCTDGNCPAFEMVGWAAPPAFCRLPAALGMIDTVVNADHEALAGQALEIVSVMGKDDEASSAVHGTAIAALLIGAGETRTPGLMPDARLVAIEAFHRDHAGDAADAYKLVLGMEALQTRAIRVVNMSFAGPPNDVLERAVERAAEGGMILVAAVGNGGPKAEPAYPGAWPGVVAVTAVDRSQRVYRQAGRGEHIDFSAPGVQLWTAASISGGRFRSGTSYAVPFVSAAIAAALADAADRPAAEILDDLAATSVDLGEAGRDPTFGWGIVRAPNC